MLRFARKRDMIISVILDISTHQVQSAAGSQDERRYFRYAKKKIMSSSAGNGWRKTGWYLAFLLAVSACAGSASNESQGQTSDANDAALSDTTILIIRHAEKPEFGLGLAPEGRARARAYARYFQELRLDSKPLRLDYLVAADDSEHSQRSRLTLEPLAEAIGLKPDLRFQARQSLDLASELRSRSHGQTILICWHHREIPDLLRALGADPDRLLPHGQWPAQQFGWVLKLPYDHQGHLIGKETKRIKEHLMPED
jgi:hypothetical protein